MGSRANASASLGINVDCSRIVVCSCKCVVVRFVVVVSFGPLGSVASVGGIAAVTAALSALGRAVVSAANGDKKGEIQKIVKRSSN